MFWLGRSRGSSPSFYGDEEEEEEEEEEAENKESKGSTRALTEALTEAETRPAERRVSTPAIRIQSDGISGEGREGGGGRGGGAGCGPGHHPSWKNSNGKNLEGKCWMRKESITSFVLATINRCRRKVVWQPAKRGQISHSLFHFSSFSFSVCLLSSVFLLPPPFSACWHCWSSFFDPPPSPLLPPTPR